MLRKYGPLPELKRQGSVGTNGNDRNTPFNHPHLLWLYAATTENDLYGPWSGNLLIHPRHQVPPNTLPIARTSCASPQHESPVSVVREAMWFGD